MPGPADTAPSRPTNLGRWAAAGLLIAAYGLAFVFGIWAAIDTLMGGDLAGTGAGGGTPANAPYDWSYVIGENALTFLALILMVGAQAFLIADHRPSLLRLGASDSLMTTTGRTRRRVLIAATVAVYSLSLVAAQILQQLMQNRGTGLPAPSSEQTPTLAAMILAVHAGVAEEVIVVAGLVVAAGLFTQRALLALPILIVARLAYHLYYGSAVIPLALWAAVSAYIIWRWRSWAIVVGFIVIHVAWDALIHWPMWAHGDAILYLFGVPAVVVLAGCFIVDRRWWSTPSTADAAGSAPSSPVTLTARAT